MQALFASLKRKHGGDEDEKDDDERSVAATPRPAKPKFELDGDRPPTPPQIHLGKDASWDLEIGSLWSVSVTSLSPEAIAKHVDALTCEPNKGKSFAPGGKKVRFQIGHVLNGRLYMPPWYAKLAFPDADRVRNRHVRGESMRPEVEFAGELMTHPPQQQAIDRYVDWLPKNTECTSCIVSLPCGYGKTVWFIKLMCMLHRVTLVLAHKLPLVDQWIEEIRRFLPAARVGYIKSDRIRIEGVDVIVASTQSLFSHIETKKPYLIRLFERVGLLCMDEGHHAVASTFSKVFSSCPAQYRVILTATPRRKDGLMPKLQMIGGPVIFRAFRQVGEVYVVAVEFVSGSHREITRGKGFINQQAMTNKLMEDETRNAIAVRIIRMLMKQNRRVLIVSPRVQHLDAISDLLERALTTDGVPKRRASLFVKDPEPPKRRRKKDETVEQADRLAEEALWAWEDSGPHGHLEEFEAPLVGRVREGMEQLQRELQYESPIVTATSQMMEEGISYKQWDTLVDMDNMSDSEQVIGRILRACGTKKVPLIIDFWISLSIFSGLFWKRFKYCREEGFDTKHIRVSSVEDVPPEHFWVNYDRPAPMTL